MPNTKYLLNKWPNTFLKLCLSGEISPNLVTLMLSQTFKLPQEIIERFLWNKLIGA